jgi:hypothetical protein
VPVARRLRAAAGTKESSRGQPREKGKVSHS